MGGGAVWPLRLSCPRQEARHDLPAILSFAPLFCRRSWRHAEVLLIGAILAPGTRTVASLLRICGLAGERCVVNDHRVPSRAAWSPRAASRVLLDLLIKTFAPDGPVVLGIDDTIEPRRGKRIAAKGAGSHRASAMGARLPRPGAFLARTRRQGLRPALAQPDAGGADPWGGALPVLTALAPSERCSREHGRRHKKPADWGRQVVLQARRWLSERDLLLVADRSLAVLELLAALSRRGVACAAPSARDDRAPPGQGHAPGEPVRGAGRRGHDVAARHGAGLAWRGRAHR